MPGDAAAVNSTDLGSVVEWAAYRDAPSPQTLSGLRKALIQVGQIDAMLPSLHKLFIETGNWKIAQHIALLFEARDCSVHAMYFAHQAVLRSGGDPLARLMVAKVTWMRRLPMAVFYATGILRAQVRRIKNRGRRRPLQVEIAELNLKAHSYLGNEAAMRRWLQLLLRAGTGSTDVALQLLFGARTAHTQDLHQLAARTLSPCIQAFGGRAKALIELGVRSAFLNVLRGRR
jgi:hypothetical protein